MKHYTKFGIGLMIAFLMMLLITTVVYAQAGTNDDMAVTLQDFLVWLTAGGGVVAVSWIAERSAWFQKQTPDVKKWVQYIASGALGIGALLVQKYIPATTLEMFTPYFAVLCSVFGFIFLNQMAHVNDPAKYRG